MKKRLTIEIDEEIKKAAKVKVAKRQTTLKNYVERLIIKDLTEAEY